MKCVCVGVYECVISAESQISSALLSQKVFKVIPKDWKLRCVFFVFRVLTVYTVGVYL